MPAAKLFNNVIIGQFALTGVPVKVYVQGRFLTITDPDDVENPMIGFGMDENGQMIQFDYINVERLNVAGNEITLKTYNDGMEKRFSTGEEEGSKEGGEEEDGAAEKSGLPAGEDKKEESIVREDLPVKLRDLMSSIDINDDHLSKVFADNHGLEDGSGAPSPAAGVELQTLDTVDDEEVAGYEAVGGGDETELDKEMTVRGGIPTTSDAHHDEDLDDDPLEEISMNEIAKRFKKWISEASKEEVDADIEGAESAIDAAKAKSKAADAALKNIEKKSKEKIKAAKAQPIEEDHQGYTFGTGDIVSNINPKCPHYGSKGIINKMMDIQGKGVVAIYTVTNKGKTFKPGDKLAKTVNQLEIV